MNRDVTRRGLLRASGTTVALGIAGCLGSSREDPWGIEGTLSVANAQQFSSPSCRCCRRYASSLRVYLDTKLTAFEIEDEAASSGATTFPRSYRVVTRSFSMGTSSRDTSPLRYQRRCSMKSRRSTASRCPGMPAGSPGMGGTKSGSFTVYALGGGKTGDVYAEI